MVGDWWIVGLFVSVGAVLVGVLWRPVRNTIRESRFDQARRQFHRQRERLEARFLQLAATSGKAPRLRWEDCDFANDVTYARDRRSRRLCAFVAVTIAYEHPESGMVLDEIGSVTKLRAATAVFHFDRGRWDTLGRTVFDLNPTEAVSHFKDHFVMLGRDVPQSS